jgi:hypothetical protein
VICGVIHEEAIDKVEIYGMVLLAEAVICAVGLEEDVLIFLRQLKNWVLVSKH